MKWSYVGNWGDKGFSAVFTIVLAGILGPRDFGIVSIGLIYLGFLQLLLDQGFATALVQRKHLEDGHLNAVFWVNVELSAVLVLVSFLFAHLWAIANHAPEVASIIPVLSISIPLEALSIVQIAILKREMNFRTLTIRSNVSLAISGVIGIGLAIAGFGVWALVAQQVIKDFLALLLLWRMSSWRPKFRFSWKHLKDLMAFSVHNFIARLGIFADGQAASIALGLFFGPVAVGLYRIADRVVGSVITMAMSATQAVSLAEFSRHQDNPVELRNTVKTCIKMTAVVTIPALAGLAMVSRPLLATIGPQWIVADNVLKVLCLAGILMVFTFFSGPLLQALAKTRHFAILEWSRTVVGFILLVAAGMYVRHGVDSLQIMGIALARLAGAVFFTTPVFLWILFHYSKITVRDFIHALKPSLIASLFIIAAVSLMETINWPPLGSYALRLTFEVVIGAFAGLPAMLFFDPELRRSILAMVRRNIAPKSISP